MRTSMYIAEAPRWEHYDFTPCAGGPGIPVRQWTTVKLPLRCRDHHRALRHVSPSQPFWLDGLPGNDFRLAPDSRWSRRLARRLRRC